MLKTSPRSPPSLLGSDSGKGQPSAPGLNNKPCSACRRRKVRCDKNSAGCNNCAKHGLVCVYDSGEAAAAAALAFGTDQAALHERMDRLERLMEDVSASCRRCHGSSQQQQRPNRQLLTTASTPSHLQQLTPEERGTPDWGIGEGCSTTDEDEMDHDGGHLLSGSEMIRPGLDVGVQILEPHASYYTNSTFWANMHDFISEPQCLLRTESLQPHTDAYSPIPTQSPPYTWPLSQPTSQLDSMSSLPDASCMQLPLEKQTVLFDFFFSNVHPFFNCTHRQSWRDTLEDFRRGTCPIHQEFEAVMFTQQLLAANAMTAEHVQRMLGQSKAELVTHLRAAAEAALARADVFRTRKLVAVQALLYYICFLFRAGQPEPATILSGLASRVAMRLGLHRDPRHFNFSPRTSETRRRVWNLLVLLNSQLFSGEGTDSDLNRVSDVQRPANADDEDWAIGTTDARPEDGEGYTEASYGILMGELAKLSRKLGEMMGGRAASTEEMHRTIDATEAWLRQRFIGTQVDEGNPVQAVTAKRFEGEMACQRLAVGFHGLKQAGYPTPEQQSALFHRSLTILESQTADTSRASTHNLSWVFSWPVPWTALACVLSGLSATQPHRLVDDTCAIDRAWTQIEAAFSRHGSPDSASWRAIEQLCDQAMLCHPDRCHAGAAYSVRRSANHQSETTSQQHPSSSSSTASPTSGPRGQGSGANTPPVVKTMTAAAVQGVSAGTGAPENLFANVNMFSSPAGFAGFDGHHEFSTPTVPSQGLVTGLDDLGLYENWRGQGRGGF